MKIRNFAGIVLSVAVTACSSSGDTKALLIESAEACSLVCTDYPDIESFSYEAGGGSPLLFIGKIEAACACTNEAR